MKLLRLRSWLAFLGCLVLVLGFSGCGTPETANKSDRPWNTPRSWEHGLPSGINEGR
ncbi:MAG: hypothetical protein JNN07_03810 [Verrucomicrobiales bacterium]|nr:hypothetical protein [Verrucomicrobiales bacterium]